MSLSGQYLEELSRRYKRQVEELQSSFAKTLLNIEEQSRRSLERKQELFEQNQKLRDDFELLTKYLFSWQSIAIFGISFISLQLFLFYVALRIYTQKYWPKEYAMITASDMADIRAATTENIKRNMLTKIRRKSAEEKRQNINSKKSNALQKRPSTEALKIAGTYEELLIKNDDTEDDIHDIDSHSLPTHKNRTVGDFTFDEYVRIEDLKQLYDKPVLNDDYEIYGLPMNLDEEIREYEDSETTMDSSVEVSPDRKLPRRKITIPIVNSTRGKSKAKARRLSSPSFFKTPFYNSKIAAEQATGWEWHRSGRKPTKSSHNNNSKKSKSESPDPFRSISIDRRSKLIPNETSQSEKIRNSNDSMRSSIASSNDGSRKDSGGFRRLMKRIF